MLLNNLQPEHLHCKITNPRIFIHSTIQSSLIFNHINTVTLYTTTSCTAYCMGYVVTGEVSRVCRCIK